jgi:signal peptidase II
VNEVADQPAQRRTDSGDTDLTDRSPSPEPAPPSRQPGRGRPAVVLGIIAVLVVAADLITKELAVAHLREGVPVKWLGGALYLVLIRNGGAAFSMGTGHTWVFPLIALVVIGWIVWMATRLRSVLWAVALGLVLGGAAGNLGDRLFRPPGFLRGEVVDFLSLFSPDGAGWAIFNVADSALCCGVVLAILLELLGKRRDGLPAGTAESARTAASADDEGLRD